MKKIYIVLTILLSLPALAFCKGTDMIVDSGVNVMSSKEPCVGG